MPFDATTTVTVKARTTPAHALHLNVRMPDGGWLAPPAEAGVRVMDLLARFGLPVREDCRGRCMCATCRASIPPAWGSRLSPPSTDETALLSSLAEGGGTTRLLCGLVMTHELDGLELELHWDALVPQTYWIAG